MGHGRRNCGATCVKISLFTFNFVFWLSGLALLGLGVWAFVDQKSLTDRIEYIVRIAGDESVSLEMTAIIFMAVGGFIVVVGFCGCCGAIKEIPCLLGFYVFFVVIIMAAEIIAGVLAITYSGRISKEVENFGKKFLKNEYAGKSTDVDVAWNYIMQEFQCCGTSGPQDFLNSKFDNTSSMTAPHFCCVPAEREDFNPNTFAPQNPSLCTAGLNTCARGTCSDTQDYYYNEGCFQSVTEFIKDNYLIFVVVALVIGSLEIFGLVFAICLCRVIDKDD